MRNAHEVAVIVVTYNRKQDLVQCVQALLDQTVECDIIIVDNASTDGTQGYLAKHIFVDKQRIHYLCLEDNLGGSGGFHHGLNYALDRKSVV